MTTVFPQVVLSDEGGTPYELEPDANGSLKVAQYDSSGQALEFLEPLSLFSAKGQNALVADTAEEILPADASRVRAILVNTHATIVAYVGDSNAVTTSNGFPLAPGGVTATAPATSRFEVGPEYTGPLWCIATGGTPTIAYVAI